MFRGAPMKALNFNIVSLNGGNVNYNPVEGAQPSLLFQNDLQALVSVLPIRNVTIDNTYLLDRDHAEQSVYENRCCGRR